jgi:hypothetical protein
MKCPQCRIEIDYCLRCQGVWLDPGEFEKIIGALEAELVSKEVPEFISASLQEAREILSGPESVFSEWRDFLTVLRMLEYRVLSENPRVARALAAIQVANPFQ